jgi:hypothetical protein
MADSNPYDDLFSPEDMAKFSALWNRHWKRVDPETKKPHANSTQFFWEVAHMFPAVKAGGNMNAPEMNFQVQRYYRGKTYEAQLEDKGATVTRHLAFHEVNPRGELVSPGYIMVSYDDFLKQFVEDK